MKEFLIIKSADLDLWWDGHKMTNDLASAVWFETPEDVTRAIIENMLDRVVVVPAPTAPNHVAAMEAQTGDQLFPLGVPIPADVAAPQGVLLDNAERMVAEQLDSNRQHLADDLGMHLRYVGGEGETMKKPRPLPTTLHLLRGWAGGYVLAGRWDDENDHEYGDLTREEAIEAVLRWDSLAQSEPLHVTRAKLEEMVEGAFRFDTVNLTAYRIAEHVVKQLGIRIVEEG